MAKNQNIPRKQEAVVVPQVKKTGRPSGNHQVGGKAIGGHRSTRARANARKKAKATGRIVRKAAVARERLGRMAAHILRGLKIL